MTTTPHPLDRPVWNALATRHAGFALGGALARRYPPDIGQFAARADDSAAAAEALLALAAPGARIATVEPERTPTPAQTETVFQAELVQMLLDTEPPPARHAAPDWVALGKGDAAEMVALAGLTRPGPFFAGTHRLGDFVGVRRDGVLVAMAGERMRLPGFTEVSAVCTHPDWRGRGLGEGLMRVVIARALARGEAVFLHSFPDNPAMRLYTALGFRVRRQVVYTILERQA